MRRTAILVALGLAAAAVVVAVLASQGGDAQRDPAGEASGTSIPGNADPAKARVIQRWASTLRSGDIDGAARFFAIPSVAENGPILIRIENRGDARAFNASLPCGARLIRAEQEGEFTVATFRLTERPGPGLCGPGTGGTAITAFVIEQAKIVEWRRVAADGEQAPSRAA